MAILFSENVNTWWSYPYEEYKHFFKINSLKSMKTWKCDALKGRQHSFYQFGFLKGKYKCFQTDNKLGVLRVSPTLGKSWPPYLSTPTYSHHFLKFVEPIYYFSWLFSQTSLLLYLLNLSRYLYTVWETFFCSFTWFMCLPSYKEIENLYGKWD